MVTKEAAARIALEHRPEFPVTSVQPYHEPVGLYTACSPEEQQSSWVVYHDSGRGRLYQGHRQFPNGDRDGLIQSEYQIDVTFAPTGERGVTIVYVEGDGWISFFRRKDGWIQVSGPGEIGDTLRPESD